MISTESFPARAPISSERQFVREFDRHPAPPVWFTALVAYSCRAAGQHGTHPIHWIFDSGRALYTNPGVSAERIEAFGVQLDAGDTVSVTWIPGETAYTVETSVELKHVA